MVEYVGAEDRLLYIIDGDNAHYSPDGASSTMTAIQTFRQKSIRTVYNVDKSESELPTCWGLESSMEGDLVDVGDVSRGKSSGNGRLNTLQCLLGSNYQTVLQWTDVLDVWSTNPEDRYKLKINDALHAVLTRNRDLDGDNIVVLHLDLHSGGDGDRRSTNSRHSYTLLTRQMPGLHRRHGPRGPSCRS